MKRLGDQLAAQLVDALAMKGWTQADLARETGLTPKHINHMTQGKSGSLAAYDFAAFALGCEWTVLLDEPS